MMVNKNLGKKYLAEILKKRTGYSLLFSKKLIDDLLEIIKFQIKNNKVIFKNFGSFEILSKKKRLGRNPKTKETFEIPQRISIKFVASKNLQKKMNFQ